VSLLLKAGAPVNCRVTEDSSTPLHKACAGSKSGHLTAVKLLLNSGADVHALNKWRETPLLTAANHGQAGAVFALLTAGADPCKCTDTGWSPLSIAAYKGHDDVVKLLLEVGEAPTEEADPTLSALLQAATKGLPETVKLLLHHGADHTVTTKKGDTALSILVEQNLIDAAVDMVTEYKASVPRCSRDRKKVQRARLLINLQIKKQQREGISTGSDDDEMNLEENEETIVPPHDGIEGEQTSGSNNKKKNKKKKKKKMSSAEKQAKAAEEALLLELEQEDAEKQKQEQEANKKSAKKRKKKERERQQKKEQEERRLAEEKELEEKRRKEKEAKEAAERAEREKQAAAKRKEEEERHRRQQKLQQKKEQEQLLKAQQQDAQEKAESEKRGAGKATNENPVKSQPIEQQAPMSQPVATRQTISTHVANPPAPVAPRSVAPSKTGIPALTKAPGPAGPKATGNNRGWETKASKNSQEVLSGDQKVSIGSTSLSDYSSQVNGKTIGSDIFGSAPHPGAISSLLGSRAPVQDTFTSADAVLNGLSNSPQYQKFEHPAISLFRRDKVSELFQRCAMARRTSDPLGVVKEETIKKVIYRWMVRAAHQSSAYLDCVIPSWIDSDELTTFFQRQYISESRRGVNSSASASSMVSMESLKEAGSAMASLCQNLAKELTDFQKRLEDQFPADWSDATIGMNASDFMQNGGGAMVVIDWASRSQVYLPSLQFTRLRKRYTGPPSRLLTALFIAKIRYETKNLMVADTTMDCRLPPETQSVLSKFSVSTEAWSSPFSAFNNNVFWGQFVDVDFSFGGLNPFSYGEGSEDILTRHGGSVSVMPPLDNMVSSRYVRHMVDLLAASEKVPLSFAVFFRADCFLDCSGSPSIEDLHSLDPRLRDNNSILTHVEKLMAGKHYYFSEKPGALEMSLTGSLFVLLQNEEGRASFNFGEAAIAEVIRSLNGGIQLESNPSLIPSNPFSNSGNDIFSDKSSLVPPGGYFNPAPVSPLPSQPISSDFGPVGGANLASTFTIAPSVEQRRVAPRRGRLFDLVDDGEEDNLNDVDVVSGMLENLNMDLFQNPMGQNSQDIDIEAISLMGIGAPPQGGSLQPRNSRGRFG
jgi:hypothetical protein